MSNETYGAPLGDRQTSGPAAGFVLFAATMIMVGIFHAIDGLVASFLFIPYHPLWSIAAMVIDIFVIWAVAAYGRDFRYTTR